MMPGQLSTRHEIKRKRVKVLFLVGSTVIAYVATYAFLSSFFGQYVVVGHSYRGSLKNDGRNFIYDPFYYLKAPIETTLEIEKMLDDGGNFPNSLTTPSPWYEWMFLPLIPIDRMLWHRDFQEIIVGSDN